MNFKTYFFIFIITIFTISCNKSIIDSETLTSNNANELKAGTIGTNYYVSTKGSNSNPGTLASPFLTIQKAADLVAAGDTVFIRGGTYQLYVSFATNGTSDAHITVKPYQSEIVLVEGNNYTIPSANIYPLFNVSGNYVDVRGITVQYSRGMGIRTTGTNNTVSHVTVHHNMEQGIIMTGNYSICEYNLIYQNAYSNLNGASSPSPGWWPSACSIARYPTVGCVMRHNVSHDNWGEGISVFEAQGVIIEDNVSYDNWSANYYISDAANTLFQRNVAYMTKTFPSGGQYGLLMGDEKSNPVSSNITIVNNVIYNCSGNFYYWGSNQGYGITNLKIENNTFVNSTKYSNIAFASVGTNTGIVIKNNLISQAGALNVIGITNNSGYTFSNNLWSKTPSALAQGSSDVIGNPLFVSSTDFSLQLTSPAINKGINIGLTTDFLENAIVGLPDMGAYEYSVPIQSAMTYYNKQTAATSVKSDCGTGYTGSTVTYTVAASKYSSTVSQIDADSKATADITANKQTYANANGTCTAIPVTVFYNTQISGTAIKNDCGTGYTGSVVTYTIAASKYSSTVSQADANGKATADLTANKQTYANTNGTCTAIPVTVYYNIQKSGRATKNDCDLGYVGSKVTYIVVAKRYNSTISQVNADAKATRDVRNNKQAYANANGTCNLIK